jgi:hypothetical protein
MPKDMPYIRWFDTLRADDIALVGGKNASLGEMIRTLKATKIRVPDGSRQTRFNCYKNQGVAPDREYATRPAYV